MKKINKKPKKTPLGWKKEKSNFVYYFKESVSKRFKIKKIEFLNFKVRPVGLSLYGTGGGFNRMQSKKIGGDFLLSFLADRYKREIRLIVHNGNTNAPIKVLKKSVTIPLSFTFNS